MPLTTSLPTNHQPTNEHLCINLFGRDCVEVLHVVVSISTVIHLPDGARHSVLREAAVKPAASDQVFSLDDVLKVVRQELFCAHRGKGRRGNGSQRRRAGEQVYWVAEKKRRRRQASDEFAGETICWFVWRNSSLL